MATACRAITGAVGLGAFQAEYTEKRWRPLGRAALLAAVIVFLAALWLLILHPGWVGLVPLALVSAGFVVGGLFLYGRNLAVVKPTKVAVYEAGLVYMTVLNARPQAVKWEQMAEARVVEGGKQLVKHDISSWREEVIEADYLVTLCDGRQISLGSLEYAKPLLALVAKHIG